MKKLGIAAVLTLVFVTLSAYVCFAQDSIVESPDIKVVIDGKLTTYNDVVVSVNQRTMLPLRAILVNLGVQNDDRHILWNNSKKSVTIIKDSTKIVLKQGSTTAYINDAAITLDAAPIGYSKNGRTYIPARFVAQSLGKKVIWDGSSKSVLIKDESDFNQVKAILEKSNAAMKAISKTKFSLDMDMDMSQAAMNMKVNARANGETDQAKKSLHMNMTMNMLGTSLNTEYYMADKAQYIKNPMTNTWEKMTLNQELYDKEFNDNSNAAVLNANDPLSAGLVVTQGENTDEVVLKGDVYLDGLLNKVSQSSSAMSKFESKKFYMEVFIDKTTNLVKKINMTFEGTMAVNAVNSNVKMNISITFSDYNGNFDIVIPDEVLKNAVENKIAAGNGGL